MADAQPRLLARLTGSSTPVGRLWLAVAAATASAAVLAGAAVLVALATLLHDNCGEDWRWVGLVAATAVAVLVGLTAAGLSRCLHEGRPARWTTVVVVITAAAWAVAVARPLATDRRLRLGPVL